MERSVCNRNCWVLGAIVGVVVLLFTSGIGDLGWGAGLFLGILAGGLLGAMMAWLVCNERPVLFEAEGGLTSGAWEREAADRQPETLLTSAPLGPEAVSSLTQMPLAAGAMRAEMQAAAPDAAPEPAPEPVASIAPDDLKRIKGIGPKLSEWLHENGVTQFAQIAAWDSAAVADFAERMGRMGGRIQADDWVGQAKTLAAGGETAFSHRVDEGGVY